ncbi:hypothetical protein JKF63_01009 [Porcisia hertigi]|uniref:Uncharacterized protein n=1 Tax=Porcisia hertigi TaxID=2761500 RepID=A0A836I8I9_9TRYP|nr:hypothetical protein JKF63_01009 [Porcisia hertigi]
MHAKEVWSALLRATECAMRQTDSKSNIAVEDAVASDMARHPHLSRDETMLVRNCAFGLLRFANLSDGAFEGYRGCYKRNGAYRSSMCLIAYLFIFQYRTLGGVTIREMLQGSMPTLRLCEFLEFLLSSEAVLRHAVPLWRAVYDDFFIQHHVLAPLSSVAADATHNVVEWLRGQPSHSATAVDPPATEGEASGFTERPTLPVPSRASPPPPALRPLADTRLPPYEVRQMAFAVPEPRLPRIKSSFFPPHAPHKRAPTTPVGFSFHHREAAVSATHPANAGDCSTSADQNIAAKRERLSPAKLRMLLSTSKSVPTTAAALWRETCVRERQLNNAERALQSLELGVHDATEWQLWRQAQREEEERRREIEAVQRHINATEAEDRVRAQRERGVQAHWRKIQAMKKQYQEVAADNRREKERALLQREQHVQQMRRQLSRDCAAAIDKSVANKSAVVAQVKQELEQLRATAQEASVQRQTQQVMMIQEIHRLRERLRERRAATPAERRRVFVDGERDAALGRMSLAEVSDALERLRAEAAAEEATRRQQVAEMHSRAHKKREHLERKCLRDREEQRQAHQVKLTQHMNHKAAVEAERVAREAVRVAQLHEKLEGRRQAKKDAYRATLEAERQRSHEVLLRSQDGASMERKRWLQYEAGLVRRAAGAQLSVLREAQQAA